MEQGKFMVLEGIDGSGTTTQGPLLVKYLFEKLKKNVPLLTREPTQLSTYGQELRRRLSGNLLPGEQKIDNADYWAELFIQDRKWHNDHLIVPCLGLGLQVISDRYKLSTIAYQSTQGKNMDELIQRHDQLDLRVPDLTLFLDVSAAVAERRIQQTRNGTIEYFEASQFQEKVQNNYLLAIDKLKAREKIVKIDGTQSIDTVAKAIQEEVNQLYGYT